MADTIELRGLRFLGRHGVLDFEREIAQPFEVDLDLEVDLRVAGQTDALSDTVSYCDVVDSVKSIVEDESHQLIERLAERIAQRALTDERITSVEVCVKKPHAAVNASLDYAAVRIRRP